MIKKRVFLIIMSMAGVLLLLLGSCVFTSDEVKMVSGLCFGIGSAALVLGAGYLLQSFIISAAEDEKIKRAKVIEVNDERNMRIREKTGYMAGKIMNYIICAFILALGFMNADKIVIIMAASLLLAELILVIAFSNYYSKKL